MEMKPEQRSKPEGTNGNPEKYFTLWLDRLEDSISLRFNALDGILIERDKRYEERHLNSTEATRVALEALKNATGLALTAADKAAEKAAQAQDQYNTTHNDLIKKMDVQRADTLPRTEATPRFERLESDMRTLREYRSASEGRVNEKVDNRGQSQWSIGIVVAIALSLLALLVPFIIKTAKP
jgi:hypothetical protein